MYYSFAGVDPGLVHTGVVHMEIDTTNRVIVVNHQAVVGPDALAVARYLEVGQGDEPVIWIEKYRPRGHLGVDPKMVKAEHEMKNAMSRALLINNTGVKAVIRRPLMEKLGLWKFSTVTHHQDLRSAARIMLYGMVKNEGYNRVLADIVADVIAGKEWRTR